MNALIHYSFSIVRYVPDIVREEFVNIGVLIFDLSNTHPPTLRLTRDWTRLRCIDQTVDIETLGALEEDLILQLNLNGTQGANSFMETIQDSFSNNLQLTQCRGRAAESMESLAGELMTLYVLPPVKVAPFALAAGS